VLWERGALAPEETARFHTKSGLLTAVRKKDWIELDFPATPDEPAEAPAGLVEALGATPQYVGKSIFDYLVELDSEETVRGLRPDLRFLATLGTRGVVVTSRSASPDLSPGTSRRPTGSTKTPSPARPTVPSRPSGQSG
jgi:predicted PhzF superfamily epimerase YddE/YHI9